MAHDYRLLLSDISGVLDHARTTAARAVNSVLTATYWEVGRRIVEFEQGGKDRADYGKSVLARLSQDLTATYGRGFSERNLEQMRGFHLEWEIVQIPSGQFTARVKCPTLSSKSAGEISKTLSSKLDGTSIFPLPWSHYVRLLKVENLQARAFYESESLRGGWSVRQLDRQIGTQFYERALGSKDPQALLARGQTPQKSDAITVEEQIRDPYLLEFLNLKDEYSETDLEEALIRHMEWFLLELGSGFTFVARQKRIRVGNSWYRIDLLLYHHGLRCLVIVDLKRGPFTHADAGQMNLYLNYAREHLKMPGETDPVGIILCSETDDAVVKYATGGIRARVFASKYLTHLPGEEVLRREILKTQRAFELRGKLR